MPNGPANSKKGKQASHKSRKRHQGGVTATTIPLSTSATEPNQESVKVGQEEVKEDGLGEKFCHICAELMEKKWFAVAQCNHWTCHACALRLRVLYKKTECTFCKSPQPVLIITASADRLFETFSKDDAPFNDSKLSIKFETQEMMEDCLLLLRYNCPDVSCDYVASSWPELKHHTRSAHGLLLCNLCLRHKKIFAHEQSLYTPQQLSVHLPTARGFASKHASTSVSTPSIDVHPVCEFCDEALYGADEHFAHMRQRHEECFVCKAGGVMHQYFQNYDSLERHFQSAHHPCPHPECIMQKFVVFPTPLDLKAHVLERHGQTLSSRDLRDMRRVETGFIPSETSRARQVRPGDRQSVRERDASSRDLDDAVGTPNQTRRQLAFSGNLSAVDSPANTGSGTPSLRTQDGDPSPLPDEATFFSRFAAATHGSSSAIPAIKAAVHAYRTSESRAQDLVNTMYTLLGQDVEAMGPFIPLVTKLFNNEEKQGDFRATWSRFKAEREQDFPSLVPSNFKAISVDNRAIRVKKLQADSSRPQLWDRVAQAAESAPSAPRPLPVFRPTAASSSTPWSRSAATLSNQPSIERPRSSALPKPSAPNLSAFPSLPPSNVSRPPKEFISGQSSLRAIAGTQSTANAWTSSTGGEVPRTPETHEAENSLQPSRKKKATKQTLFTLGSLH